MGGVATATAQVTLASSPVGIHAASTLEYGAIGGSALTAAAALSGTTPPAASIAANAYSWGWHEWVLLLWMSGAVCSFAFIAWRHYRVMRSIRDRRPASTGVQDIHPELNPHWNISHDFLLCSLAELLDI